MTCHPERKGPQTPFSPGVPKERSLLIGVEFGGGESKDLHLSPRNLARNFGVTILAGMKLRLGWGPAFAAGEGAVRALSRYFCASSSVPMQEIRRESEIKRLYWLQIAARAALHDLREKRGSIQLNIYGLQAAAKD